MYITVYVFQVYLYILGSGKIEELRCGKGGVVESKW